jgi:hypothetical protein
LRENIVAGKNETNFMPEIIFSPSLSVFKIIIKEGYDVLEYYAVCSFL